MVVDHCRSMPVKALCPPALLRGSNDDEAAAESAFLFLVAAGASCVRCRRSHSILHSAATSVMDLHVRCLVQSALTTSLRVWFPSAFASTVEGSLRMAAKSGGGIPPGSP